MFERDFEARLREREFLDVAGQFGLYAEPISEGLYELKPVSLKKPELPFQLFYDPNQLFVYVQGHLNGASEIGAPMHRNNGSSINALRTPKELLMVLQQH